MADWDASQYLKFEDERTRPALDLLRQCNPAGSERCIDLGCGPGNSTELLVQRFPNSSVIGLDSSPDMLAKAKARLPSVEFVLGDISTWQPSDAMDLIYANAALQWVPGHEALVSRLASYLRTGGVLAVQMPDNLSEPSHQLMNEVAAAGPWAAKLDNAKNAKAAIGSFEDYYGWARKAGCAVNIWRTTYVHPLEGPEAIVEWLMSTGLKPFLDRLDADERPVFLQRYLERIALAYPAQNDGKVLLRFPRLFLVARKL